jgi:DNA-binding NarL/FixJ family response regulator
VKKDLLSESGDFSRQHTVMLCGDVFLHRRLLKDSVSSTAGLTLIRCSEDREQLFPTCRRLNASIIVARQAFIEQLTSVELIQLTNYGKGCYVLAILESDCLEASSAPKLLRLGCRGILPPRFPSKLFRRAVLTVLRGELWAPGCIVSALLTDLLRAAALKSESGLTPQEARILELTMQGYKNSAIAETLFISLETVRWHKRRLNRKLRGPSRLSQDKATVPTREKAAS